MAAAFSHPPFRERSQHSHSSASRSPQPARSRSSAAARPRSTSPPASSDDDDSGDEFVHLTLLGTPLDPTEQQHRRIAREKAQQRHRKEEEQKAAVFTPAAFRSSRSQRAAATTAAAAAGGAEGKSGVAAYQDELDVEEEMKEGLTVRAELESARQGKRGRPEDGEAAAGDALLLALAPAEESVARRMLRRMGWRDGNADEKWRRRGKVQSREAGAAEEKDGAEQRQGERKADKRRQYTVALPPSMQAMLEEEQQADEQRRRDGEEDEDEEADSLPPLPAAAPLFSPVPKQDRHGLGYDPLLHAEEFAARRQSAREQRQQRMKEDDDDVLDGDIMEVWMKQKAGGGRDGAAAAGKGSRASRDGGQRRPRLPGFLSQQDDAMDDDDVDVYSDQPEELTATVGRSKAERQAEQQREERRAAATVAQQEPLTFVRAEGTAAAVSDAAAVTTVVVPPGWDGWHEWDEREEEEARARMADVLREWAEKKRRDRALREKQLEMEKAAQRAEQHRSDHEKHSGDLNASRIAPPVATLPSLPMPPPPPPVPPPPLALTPASALLADSFFSRFTTASASDAPVSPPAEPPLPSTPPPQHPIASSISAHATAADAAAATREFGPESRSLLPWRPEPLLCKRLEVEPPTTVAAPAGSASREAAGVRTAAGGDRATPARTRRHQAEDEATAAAAVRMRPPDIPLDRPPSAVLKAVFGSREEEDRQQGTQSQPVSAPAASPPPAPLLPRSAPADVTDAALRLLSSISLPSSSSLSVASNSTPALPSLPPPAPAAGSNSSGFVHPSRRHLVPAAAVSQPASSAVTAPPASSRPRVSRWGDRPSPATAVVTQQLAKSELSPTSSAAAARPLPVAASAPSSASALPPAASPPSSASLPVPASAESPAAKLKAELVEELARLQRLSEQERRSSRRSKKERKKDKKKRKDSKRRSSSSSSRRSGSKREKEHRRRSHGSNSRSGRSSDDSSTGTASSDSSSSSPRIRRPTQPLQHRSVPVVDLT